MILLYIYAGVSVLAFAMTMLISINGAHIFKQRYPDIHASKSHWSGRIIDWVKIAIACAIPVFNAYYLLYLVAKSDEITEAAVRKVHAKYTSDKGDPNA